MWPEWTVRTCLAEAYCRHCWQGFAVSARRIGLGRKRKKRMPEKELRVRLGLQWTLQGKAWALQSRRSPVAAERVVCCLPES